MKKTLFIIAVIFLLILTGCKPRIMIAQEIANSVELEVDEQYPYTESFELPEVNKDVDVEYKVNWTSNNPLLEIKKENDKFIAYLKNDYETEPTQVIITLEITVGNQTAYKRFQYNISRRRTQAELYYSFVPYENDYVVIKEYKGRTDEDTLIIPNEIYYEDGDGNPANNYKKVKIIDENAFASNFHSNESIKKVIIPASVTEIKRRAFAYNSNLEEVIFEENSKLRLIEDEVFLDNSKLSTFKIPYNVEHIGSKAFYGTSITNFISSKYFEWKDNILIGKNTGSENRFYAIYVNPFVKSIRFPDEVKTINSYICSNYHNLKTVDFNLVTAIGLQAFTFSSVETIINVDNITSVDFDDFLDTPWLKKQKDDYIFIGNCILKYRGYLEHIDIADNVVTICKDAFAGNSRLKTVFIGDNVKNIGTNAFGGCHNLEWIVLEDVTPPFIGSDTTFGEAKLYVKNPDTYKKHYWSLPNEITTKEVNVRFFDRDGNLLKEDVLTYGKTLVKQDKPMISGYKFIGWMDSTGIIHKEYDIFKCYLDEDLTAYYEESHLHVYRDGLCDCGKYNDNWLNENFDLSEEKILFTGSVDDDFNCDIILLTLKHTTTFIKLSDRHFKLDCISKVEYVGGPRPPEYYFKEEYKHLLENYHQIVFLHVENQSKAEIIELIKQLEQIEFIRSVSPNSIESPDV